MENLAWHVAAVIAGEKEEARRHSIGLAGPLHRCGLAKARHLVGWRTAARVERSPVLDGAIAFTLMPFRADFRSDAAARLGRPSDPAGGRRRLSPPVDWNGASCRGRDGARQGRMRPDRGHERHNDRQRHQFLSRVEVRAEDFPARARGRIAAKAPARLSARQPPSLKAFWDLQSLNSCLTTSRHGITAGTKRRAPRPFSMRSTGSSHDRPMDEICSSA